MKLLGTISVKEAERLLSVWPTCRQIYAIFNERYSYAKLLRVDSIAPESNLNYQTFTLASSDGKTSSNVNAETKCFLIDDGAA